MKITQIKETCLYVQDLEKARVFYHETLGLPVITYLPGRHIFFRAGTSVLLCFNPADSRHRASPPGHWAEGKYHFAFEVAPGDYESHKMEIRAKGVRIIDQVVWQNGQESFYFEDPEGNVLEIVPAGIWQ